MLRGEHVAAGDVVDVDDVQRGVDVRRDAPVQELDDRPTGGRRRGVAFADRERRVHEHDGKPGGTRRATPRARRDTSSACSGRRGARNGRAWILGGEASVLGDADRAHGARVDEPAALRLLGGRGPRSACRRRSRRRRGPGRRPRTGRPRPDGTRSTPRRSARSSVAGSRMSPTMRSTRQAGEIVVVPARLAQRADLVAVADQRAHDRRADEPGGTGDEHRSGSAGPQARLLTYPATASDAAAYSTPGFVSCALSLHPASPTRTARCRRPRPRARRARRAAPSRSASRSRAGNGGRRPRTSGRVRRRCRASTSSRS